MYEPYTSHKDMVVDGRAAAFGYFYLTTQNILSMLIGVLKHSFLSKSVSQINLSNRIFDATCLLF